MTKKFTLSLLAALCAVLSAMAQATPPSTATIETWYVSYTMSSSYGTESDTEAMQVAFDGSNVYFNLPNPLSGATWVKGSIGGSEATFAAGQLIANYGGTNYYMVGSTGSDICDVVFNYDAQTGVFSLKDMYLLLNSNTTSVSYVAYFSVFTIVKNPSEEPDDGSQTPPASATKETWNISYTFVSGGESETGTEQMEVAFVGGTVYFNFPNPIQGNTWMRGKLDGQTATFAKGQVVGNYGGTTIYYMGLGTDNVLTDIAFNYDANAQQFTLADNWLVLNGSLTQSYALGYFSSAIIKKGGDTPPSDVVTPPAGLVASEYAFTASNITFDSQEGWKYNAVKYNVRLGMSGNDAYLQGLCRSLPTAWLQGKRDVNDGELTFASGQYYGAYETGFGPSYDFFFAAGSYPVSAPTWADEASFAYDAQAGTYTSSDVLMLNSSATQIAPYELYAGAKLTKIYDRVATPAAPVVNDFTPFNAQTGFGQMLLTIPLDGTAGEDLLSDKLGYQLFVESEDRPYVFNKDRYRLIPEQQMTLVPYNYSDGYDIFLGGSAVYFYDDLKDAKRIGVQSVYDGGGERRVSAITWIDVDKYLAGIEAAATAETSPVSATYTDLQGRPVPASAKGLLLKTVRMSDGTKKTVKVIRK